jgi:tRNA wybutosine-synthesizing protein 1
MVVGENMINPREYADLILRSETDFVEVKGFMYIGSSRNRMNRSHAPTHRDVQSFAQKLSDLTGYILDDEQIESRVVLLSRSKNISKLV